VRIPIVAFASFALLSGAAHALDRYQVSAVPDPLGLGVGSPLHFVDFKGELYFRGETAAHGYELFKYDGSEMRLAADVAPGQLGGNVFDPIVFQGNLYFASTNGVTGYELFRFDGSAATLIADIYPGPFGSTPQGMLEFQDKLVFSADGPSGRGVYSFDGMNVEPVAGASPVADNWLYFRSVGFGGKLLFTAHGGTATGYELYEYDGSSATLVADIRPGSDSSEPIFFTELNGKVVFTADDGVSGPTLFEYDGISVRQVSHEAGVVWTDPQWLTEFNGDVYFAADGGPSLGIELFKYDGNAVSLVADIASGFEGSGPNSFAEFDNSLFFIARRKDVGTELFRFDGASVSLVTDMPSGVDSIPGSLFPFEGELLFRASSRLMKVSVVPEPPALYSLFALVGLTVCKARLAGRRIAASDR
jgi:trimeric autotransporter adhesin